MSAIRFLNNPFPDNHNGFDYSPKSIQDVNNEYMQKVEQKQGIKEFANMLAAIMK